jgi:nucleoside-diphosphate-sugar epimerase
VKNRLIVSGSSGFVGRNLICYFEKQGLSIISKLDRKGFERLYDGIFIDVDTIIHLAGKAHDTKNVSDPDEYYQVNFELTKRLYDAFLISDTKKFIFISSVKAVADSVDVILTEDSDPNPRTHYGKSKLMAEEYIQSKPLPAGKSYYILRPCMIHGPGNKGNLNLLYKFVKKGIPYLLAAFDNQRSFLSIQNLCFVINELVTRDNISSGIYQVADDEPLSTNEVITLLASALNKKPRLWKVPKKIIAVLAKMGDRLHLPLTTERLNKLTQNYIVSNNKLKFTLGKGLPLTSIEGLKITANSFQKTDR